MRQRIPHLLAILALVLGAAGTATASDLWLHVRVDEADGAKVKVNLPVSMMEKAISMVPQEHFRNGSIHLDDCCNDISVSELRELWQELKNSPDMTFVTVEEDQPATAVAQHEADLLGAQAGEEGHGRRAHEVAGEVDRRPLRPVLGEDGDAELAHTAVGQVGQDLGGAIGIGPHHQAGFAGRAEPTGIGGRAHHARQGQDRGDQGPVPAVR